MKSIITLFAVSVLFSLNSCSQKFQKLPDAELNTDEIMIAEKFGAEYLTTLKNGEFYEFTDEAIDAIKNQLTEHNQKASHQQLQAKYGDFESMEYAETWIKGENRAIRIYRFKGLFSGSNKKLEVRVVLNKDQKIAGFWIKPWSDMLK